MKLRSNKTLTVVHDNYKLDNKTTQSDQFHTNAKNNSNNSLENLSHNKIRDQNKNKMSEINFTKLIQSFPNFGGTDAEDIDYYLNQYEKLATLAKIDDEIKLLVLRTKLQKNALQFANENKHIQELTSFKDFKEKLTSRFQKQTGIFEVQRELENVKQMGNETVQQFALRVEGAAQKYIRATNLKEQNSSQEFSKAITLTKFISGLRPEIRIDLQKQAPTNLESATNIAKNIERALAENETELNNISMQKIISEARDTENLIQKKKIEDLEKQIQQMQLNQTPMNVTQQNCSICGKIGHFTRNCWYNKTRQQQLQQRFVTPNFPPQYMPGPFNNPTVNQYQETRYFAPGNPNTGRTWHPPQENYQQPQFPQENNYNTFKPSNTRMNSGNGRRGFQRK